MVHGGKLFTSNLKVMGFDPDLNKMSMLLLDPPNNNVLLIP